MGVGACLRSDQDRCYCRHGLQHHQASAAPACVIGEGCFSARAKNSRQLFHGRWRQVGGHVVALVGTLGDLHLAQQGVISSSVRRRLARTAPWRAMVARISLRARWITVLASCWPSSAEHAARQLRGVALGQLGGHSAHGQGAR